MKKQIPKLRWLVTAFVVGLVVAIYVVIIFRPGSHGLSRNLLGWIELIVRKDASTLTKADLAGIKSLTLYDCHRPYFHLPRSFSKWQHHIPERKISITDDDLKGLDQLTNLDWMQLNYKQLTDEAMVHVAKLPALEILIINGPQLTDAGMVHLAKLKTLERLYLGNTQVTDDGLVHLAKLPELQFLIMEGTHVTSEGVVRFKQKRKQKGLPECEVKRQP